jgi:hypothetical protein
MNYQKNNYRADVIARHGETTGLPLFESANKTLSNRTQSRFDNAPKAIPTAKDTKRLSRLRQKINGAELSHTQQMVYDCIAANGPITNREIAALLDWQVSSVAGRNFELREFGKITAAGKRACRITGEVVTAWKVLTSPELL